MKIGNNCNTEINKYLIDKNTMDFASTGDQFIIENFGLYFMRTSGYFSYLSGRYFNSDIQSNAFDTLIENGAGYYIIDFRGPTNITVKELLNDGTYRSVSINIQHPYNGLRITFDSSAQRYKCFGHSYNLT